MFYTGIVLVEGTRQEMALQSADVDSVRPVEGSLYQLFPTGEGMSGCTTTDEYRQYTDGVLA